MKRSDFPQPYSTGLVDLNSVGAYADQGLTPRVYPRYMPTRYRSISDSAQPWLLEPWRKNMKLYPQLYCLVSRDIPVRDPSEEGTVLGIGMGLACSDDGIVMGSKDPAARDQHMCYWYSLYSDNAQVLAQDMKENVRARDIRLTVESPTLGKYVFDQNNLQFDPEELIREMNYLIPFRKYDLICLGAADKPIYLPTQKRFLPGEVITVSCPQLGSMEITVDDRREPDVVIRGWKPRAYFLEPEYNI